MTTIRKAMRGPVTALFCAGFLAAGSAAAQGEIEVRSARINMKDPDVAARRMGGTQLDRTAVTSTGSVARFPTVVLGTASYQLAGTVSAPASRAVSSDGRIAAVDLLPAFVAGDSLLNIAENFAGDPTLGGTINPGAFPGTVTTDGVRFNRPITSPLFGVAGPGSSPGVAGPGAFPTQGLARPGSSQGVAGPGAIPTQRIAVPGFTQGVQSTPGVQSDGAAPGAAAPITAGRGSLRMGGRF